MKRDSKRLSGFYWVRFEGSVIVAEYTADGLGCSPEGPHWHVPQADECLPDRKVCELLSGRIEAPPAPDLFYIQNIGYTGNCLRWWRSNGHGYTSNLNEAWKVTGDDAVRICSSRPREDFPWSVEFIDELAQRHLDCEALRGAHRQRSAGVAPSTDQASPIAALPDQQGAKAEGRTNG